MNDLVRRLAWIVQHGLQTLAEALARPGLTDDEKASLTATLKAALADE